MKTQLTVSAFPISSCCCTQKCSKKLYVVYRAEWNTDKASPTLRLKTWFCQWSKPMCLESSRLFLKEKIFKKSPLFYSCISDYFFTFNLLQERTCVCVCVCVFFFQIKVVCLHWDHCTLPEIVKRNLKDYKLLWNIFSYFFFFKVSSKDEDFLDLSVDVEQNTSITHCLR